MTNNEIHVGLIKTLDPKQKIFILMHFFFTLLRMALTDHIIAYCGPLT